MRWCSNSGSTPWPRTSWCARWMVIRAVAYSESEIPVPPFKHFSASEEHMDQRQRQFYATWVRNWRDGKAPSVQGNISYLFCFAYGVLDLPLDQAAQQLTHLIEAYRHEARFAEYCQHWLSDCHVLLGDYKTALATCPAVDADKALSLKLLLGERIEGRDLLMLNRQAVTTWGKKHMSEVGAYLDVIVRAYEKNIGINLLETWKDTSRQCPYFVFVGTLHSPRSANGVPFYWFSGNERVLRFVGEITRDAENTVREEMGIPRVGEGWIAETELYYRLKAMLGDTAVVHHACPEWLGRQHLDIFIPKHSVALEFQGAQHDKPVEYFGGEKAFQATKRRDERKRKLCLENGVRLLEVRPGYELGELVSTILGQVPSSEEAAPK